MVRAAARPDRLQSRLGAGPDGGFTLSPQAGRMHGDHAPVRLSAIRSSFARDGLLRCGQNLVWPSPIRQVAASARPLQRPLDSTTSPKGLIRTGFVQSAHLMSAGTSWPAGRGMICGCPFANRRRWLTGLDSRTPNPYFRAAFRFDPGPHLYGFARRCRALGTRNIANSDAPIGRTSWTF